MEALRTIKQTLGLTDTQLSIYLGVTKSHISMVLRGHRNLSSDANLLVVRLLGFLQQLDSSGSTASLNKKSMSTKLLQLSRANALNLARTRKQLVQMQHKEEQAYKLQQLALLLQSNPLQGKAAIRENLWMNALTSKIRQQQKNFSNDKQKLLQLQLDVLLYTADRLTALKQSLI